MLTQVILISAALLAVPHQVQVKSSQAAEDVAKAGEARGGTDASVTSFLDEAQSHLYDVESAGMRSLEFQASIEVDMGPMGGKMEIGVVKVAWNRGTDPDYDVSLSDNLPPQYAQDPTMAQSMLAQKADQLFSYSRNRPFEALLRSFDAKLEGAKDGLVHVLFTPKAELAGMEAPDVSWYFGEDGLPAKQVVEMEQEAMGQKFEMTVTSVHKWRPAAGEDGALLLDRVETTTDMGMMAISQNTSFDYTKAGDIHVLSGYTEEVEQMGMKSSTTVKFDNLMVNGTAVVGS